MPLGEYDLLVLSDVGDRVDRNSIARHLAELPIKRSHVEPTNHDSRNEDENDQLVVDEEAEERFPRG